MTVAVKKARKAKRELKDIDFSGDSAHIALVCPEQGGPANGADFALVLKGGYSADFIEKASKVTVTMSIVEYLERFYHIWCTDAKVLAGIFGFDIEDEDDKEEMSWEERYDKEIQERIASVQISKALKEGNAAEVLAGIDESTHLKLLQEQETVEKALKKIEEDKQKEVEDMKELEILKARLAEVQGQAEKAVELQKSLDGALVELQKAKDELAAIHAERLEVIRKNKIQQIQDVVNDEERTAVLSKAALNLDDTDFDAFVASLKAMQKAVESSELFEEKGAGTSTQETIQKSAVQVALERMQEGKAK